jgi:hypothetical protein
MAMTITPENRPMGYYTWVAVLRNGTTIHEFDDNGDPQKSVDLLVGLDVSEFHLIPFIPDQPRSYIRLDVAPGQRVVKKWIRSFQHGLDRAQDSQELPVIDAFALIDDSGYDDPVWHYCFPDGSLLVTTKSEPPR